MERRKLLKLLGVLPSILLYSCVAPKVPSTPSIVVGMVIDENDIPIEGASLSMFGFKQTGLSGVDTFSIDTITDKSGKFTLSYLIPKGTDTVKIEAVGTSTISQQTHDIYTQKDGAGPYILAATDPEVYHGSYGKTTTLNFQFKKR